MPQAFFHGEQHIAVAAGLDVDHPVGMETSKMQGRGEQVPPAQTPKHRTLDPGEDTGQENRGAGIIGQVRTTGDLVEGARRHAAAGQVAIDSVQAKRNMGMTSPDAFDPGDMRAQGIDNGGAAHGTSSLGESNNVLIMF